MSTLAPRPADLLVHRQHKARALMSALAGQCRTPLEAVRFVLAQLPAAPPPPNDGLQRIAEAALRARLSRA